MSLTYGTVTYPPAEGCHRHVPTGSDPYTPCAECGGHRWDTAHGVTEQHGGIVADRPGLFCVEASDDGGRSYTANGLRWERLEDAERWASGLALRWFGCTHIRVRACDERGDPTGETVTQTL